MLDYKRLSLAGVATGALVTALAGSAFAQSTDYYSRDKYEAVTDRQQPEYDPEALHVGAFLVNSSLEAGLLYTSNAFGSTTNEESDTIARIGANVRARTNWSVHEVAVNLSAGRDEYQDFSDQSSNAIAASVEGRLDVTRQLALRGSVFYEESADNRSDPSNAAGLGSPIEYTRTGAQVGLDYNNGRVRWSNRASVAEEDYKDAETTGGLPVDQDFRDRTSTLVRSRLSYAVSPNFAVFGQGEVQDLEYDQMTLIGGNLYSRDSSSYTVSAGADFELDALLRGDVAVGYLNNEKDDSFFQDVSGLAIDGSLQWFPSRLTTVGLNAGRRVIDTGVLDSPSAVYSAFGARVDHELRRNIILSADANFSNYSFEEIDRDDDVVEYGVEGTYKINKHFHTSLFVRRVDRDRSGTGIVGDQTLETNLVGISLRVFP